MVGTLLEEGDLRAPPEQHHDLKKLQQAFDSGDRDHFELTLKSVEARYLSEQSA
jgi:hypothetical protein